MNLPQVQLEVSGKSETVAASRRPWESGDCVHRAVIMPAGLAERLAARAEQRGLSFSDLLVRYAEEGLQRDEAND